MFRRRSIKRASLHFSSGEVEERGFTARKCRCAESDYRRRFKICFLICSCKFEIRNRAPVLMVLLRLPLASARDSGTVSIAVLDRDCVQLSRSICISLN